MNLEFGSLAWLLVVPVLGFLVFVHELGHFLTAKYFKIKVTEFGFGFPPRLWGVQRGETIYSINWIPLGGFVKMVGEEDPSEERSFASQKVWKRAIVLAAGSFMNIVTPIVIFSVMFLFPTPTAVGDVTVLGVAPRSPAQEAGLRTGDVITAIDGETVEHQNDLIRRISARAGQSVALTVRRGSMIPGFSQSPEFSSVETLTLVPRKNPPSLTVVDEVTDPDTQVSLTEARRYDASLQIGDTMRQAAIGVTIGTSNLRIVERSYPVTQAVPMAFTQIKDVLVLTKDGIGQWVGGGDNPGFTGPIGIAQATGEVARAAGVPGVLQLTALLSISLAVINILPIPPFDGGRLAFVILEFVRGGKRIPPQKEVLVHLVGLVVVVGLVVLISGFDVMRLISGESVIR